MDELETKEMPMMSGTSRAMPVLAALLIWPPGMMQTDVAKPRTDADLAKPRTDVVLEWNAITMATVSGKIGVEQVRLAAITHLAMFEAVNAITGDFEPYLGTVSAPPHASAEAAAVTAAYTVLVEYVPERTTVLDEARKTSLKRIKDSPGKASGIAAGQAAALAVIDHRAEDGSQATEFYVPMSKDPGQWQLTPNCTDGGLFLHWRKVTPFGIKRGDQFRPPPPPSLTSRQFTRDYNEVKALGGADSTRRPADRADVARFYAAVQSQTVWNPIARTIAAARRTSLSSNARTFALLNMALNDALIAVMDAKYHYTFWRPETAILAGDTDGNPNTQPDGSFTPFISAPCHPSYPSAHAASSYAGRAILEHIYGGRHRAIRLTSPAVPDVVLHYTRLEDVTDDIDDARIYGGIHYRSDQRVGARQGIRIGEYVIGHNLRRAHDTYDDSQ
jgi:hypothetical protein